MQGFCEKQSRTLSRKHKYNNHDFDRPFPSRCTVTFPLQCVIIYKVTIISNLKIAFCVLLIIIHVVEYFVDCLFAQHLLFSFAELRFWFNFLNHFLLHKCSRFNNFFLFTSLLVSGMMVNAQF